MTCETARAVFLAVVAFGCSSSSDDSETPGTPDSVPIDDTACAVTGPAAPDAAQDFARLTVRVTDERGAPAPVLTHQVCGFDLCLYGEIDDAGQVNVATARLTPIKGPAFKYGMGVDYAQFVYPLPDQPSLDLGSVATVRFPALGSGAALSPGGRAASGDVSLDLAPGTHIDIDELTFAAAEERAFRAAYVPLELELPALDRNLGLELLVALTPVATTFCPPAKLSVANRPAWPSGSKVEFFVHGVELAQRFAPYGGWKKISDGAVSADGAIIETDPRGGIPTLSVIGIRRQRSN